MRARHPARLVPRPAGRRRPGGLLHRPAAPRRLHRLRARLALTALTRGDRFATAYTVAACEVGRDAARRLRLPEEVQHSVYHIYEEWRGGGACRPGLAVEAVRRRGGGMIEPWMAARFVDRAEALLGEVDDPDPRALVLEAERGRSSSRSERASTPWPGHGRASSSACAGSWTGSRRSWPPGPPGRTASSGRGCPRCGRPRRTGRRPPRRWPRSRSGPGVPGRRGR